MSNQNGGFLRLWRALGFSCEGLAAAWKNEAAFRLEVIAACLLLPLALWLGNTPSERALLAGSVLLVLLTELVNSAIEAITDRASPEWHELAKRAKDTGSAAVLMALGITGLSWLLILYPKL